MNKRGEDEALLPKELINLIISLICITFLIILAVAVYFSLTGNQQDLQAREIVNGKNGISEEIGRIASGGIDNKSFFVPNPSGWYIFIFTGKVKPDMCAGTSCLCVCPKLTVGIFNIDSRQAGKCDDAGACVITSLKNSDPIEIKNGGIFISIEKVNGQIQVTQR